MLPENSQFTAEHHSFFEQKINCAKLNSRFLPGFINGISTAANMGIVRWGKGVTQHKGLFFKSNLIFSASYMFSQIAKSMVSGPSNNTRAHLFARPRILLNLSATIRQQL